MNAKTSTASQAQLFNLLRYLYEERCRTDDTHIFFFACSLLYFILPFRLGLPQTGKVWKLILWQLITPIIMIALRGETPPTRVFVYLTPFIALLIGVTIAYLINILPRARLRWTALLLTLAYLVFACQRERQAVTDLMNENLRTEQRTQGLHENYYQHNFHPLTLVQFLEKNGGKDSIPVILKISEPHDMPEHLGAFGVPYQPGDSLDYYLQASKKVYLITLFPHEYHEGDFASGHHVFIQEVLPPAYHHLLPLHEINP